MYLVTMEDDEGMWMEDPAGCDDRDEAFRHARKFANRWKRPATIYKCEFMTEVEVPEHEVFEAQDVTS